MRQLKYHEYKLLRRSDFLKWKRENNQREVRIVRRYRLTNPEDYHAYNRTVGQITHLVHLLQQMPNDDPVRVRRTEGLLRKLYDMGVISDRNSLIAASKVSVSALCRRRFPVVLVHLKFAENLKEATTLIEQGHLRIGPHVITDPAVLVTRSREDFITWVDSSKIKRKISQYNDQLDDFDLLNA